MIFKRSAGEETDASHLTVHAAHKPPMRASQRSCALAVLLTVKLVDGFSIPKEIATVRAAYDAYDEDVRCAIHQLSLIHI